MTDSSELPSVSSLPWSVKGVSPAARQAAKEAAAEAGLTMGAWLSLAIRQAESGLDMETATAATTGPEQPGLATYLEKLDSKLADLCDRLQALEKSPQDNTPLPDMDFGTHWGKQ